MAPFAKYIIADLEEESGLISSRAREASVGAVQILDAPGSGVSISTKRNPRILYRVGIQVGCPKCSSVFEVLIGMVGDDIKKCDQGGA